MWRSAPSRSTPVAPLHSSRMTKTSVVWFVGACAWLWCSSAPALDAGMPPSLFTRAAGPGLHGTPFGYLGPHGTRVFEQYRKTIWLELDGGSSDGAVHVQVADSGPAHVRYENLRQTMRDEPPSRYVAAGLFAGRQRAIRTPPNARLRFSASFPPDAGSLDVRFGFAEHEPDGGRPFERFVVNHGGDTGSQDPYFGDWGVDGLFLHFQVFPAGAAWSAIARRANLVAGDSRAQQYWGESPEYDRTDHLSDVTLDGGQVRFGDRVQVGGAGQLQVEWSLRPSDGGAELALDLGGRRFVWGIAAARLRDPGNADLVGYTDGELRLGSLVPIWFLGVSGGPQAVDGGLPPSYEVTVGMTGAIPRLEAPPVVRLGAPVEVQVSAVDVLQPQALATSYEAPIRIVAADDPRAELPSGPVSLDAGVAVATVRFGSRGRRSLTALDLETEALASTAEVQVNAVLRFLEPAGARVQVEVLDGQLRRLVDADDEITLSMTPSPPPSPSSGAGCDQRAVELRALAVEGVASFALPVSAACGAFTLLARAADAEPATTTLELEPAEEGRAAFPLGCSAGSGEATLHLVLVLAWLLRRHLHRTLARTQSR